MSSNDVGTQPALPRLLTVILLSVWLGMLLSARDINWFGVAAACVGIAAMGFVILSRVNATSANVKTRSDR